MSSLYQKKILRKISFVKVMVKIVMLNSKNKMLLHFIEKQIMRDFVCDVTYVEKINFFEIAKHLCISCELKVS